MEKLVIACVALSGLFSFGCTRSPFWVVQTNTAPEQPLVIRATESPAGGDSREPELSSTADGRIILSWVEKLNAKRYALRTAMRDPTRWTEPRTVAEGDNWFINWADFPSVIAFNDNSLAA